MFSLFHLHVVIVNVTIIVFTFYKRLNKHREPNDDHVFPTNQTLVMRTGWMTKSKLQTSADPGSPTVLEAQTVFWFR